MHAEVRRLPRGGEKGDTEVLVRLKILAAPNDLLTLAQGNRLRREPESHRTHGIESIEVDVVRELNADFSVAMGRPARTSYEDVVEAEHAPRRLDRR